jgi:hypothetical protein
MTMIAPTDAKSINLADRGCGKPHEVGELADGEHWELDCVMCEPVLQAEAKLFGWATHLGSVTPTCDERAEYERNDREATRNGQRALAQMNLAANGMVQQAAAVPQLSLMDQIARMTDEEKSTLRTLLGGSPEPVKVEPVKPDVAKVEPVKVEAAAAKKDEPPAADAALTKPARAKKTV